MMSINHPFRVGDKIRFNMSGQGDFNRNFLRDFAEADYVVTVAEAVTEDMGDLLHYVRLVEDPAENPAEESAPTWAVSWFESNPITPAPTAQEAPMTENTTYAVGDKVRVTDARTVVGNSGLPSGRTYVGATATITEVVNEEDNEYDGTYTLEFDDKSLSGFGTWTHAALDLVEEAPTRPTIDFSGSSRETARFYAQEANTRLLSSAHQSLLRSVGKGEEVDAYSLNEALLAAMRATLTRHGASTKRRDTGRKIAYLGHITQAVLENHAQGLPAYQTGERSRLLAEVRPALAEAKQEIDTLVQERGLLTQAASDERRRLCAEIDSTRADVVKASEERAELLDVIGEIKAERDGYRKSADEEITRLLALNEKRFAALRSAETERDRAASVLNYAMGRLSETDKQRVLGFWDGLDSEDDA